MSEQRIREVVSEGHIDFLGHKIIVYVLDDGRRIISQESLELVMDILAGGDANAAVLREFLAGSGVPVGASSVSSEG